MLGIKDDEELSILCQDSIFPYSGTVPNVHSVLLLNKTKKAKKKVTKGGDSRDEKY